jgi:hypothetical protein
MSKKIIDLTGQRFGKLIATSFIRKNGKTMWTCLCDCGNIREVNAKSLRQKKCNSCRDCLKYNLVDITGQRFGFLIAIVYKKQSHKWKCICDCGTTKLIPGSSLRNGTSKSCGCKSAQLGNENGRVLPDNKAAENHVYGVYRRAANKRKLPFKLTKTKFLRLIYDNCFYCGAEPMLVEFYAGHATPKNISYNGIDRVNNDKGYVNSNCVSCCRICNRAKSNLPYKEFLQWIEKFVAFRNKLVNT